MEEIEKKIWFPREKVEFDLLEFIASDFILYVLFKQWRDAFIRDDVGLLIKGLK